MSIFRGYIEIIWGRSRLIVNKEIMVKFRKLFPKWPNLLKMESGRMSTLAPPAILNTFLWCLFFLNLHVWKNPEYGYGIISGFLCSPSLIVRCPLWCQPTKIMIFKNCGSNTNWKHVGVSEFELISLWMTLE